MKNLGNIILFAVLITSVGCRTQKAVQVAEADKPSKVEFIKGETFEQVLEKSKKDKKLVFVDFYIDECAPCRVMDETAFTQEPVFEFYNKNFINFKVDAIDFDYVELAMKYQVQEYPTLIFLDENGEIVYRHYGAATASKLLELGKEVLEKPTI